MLCPKPTRRGYRRLQSQPSSSTIFKLDIAYASLSTRDAQMRLLLFALGLMATSANTMATPRDVQTVSVQLSNDQSGANDNADVAADGRLWSIQSLWRHSPVDMNGFVTATSAQLTRFQQTTHCKIIQAPNVNAELDAERTWVSLNQGKGIQLKLAYITCSD